MAIAASAKSRVAYVAEVTPGIIPATPTWLVLRRTGGGLMTKKGTVESEEMNLDARTRAIYQVSQDVAGQYDFEASSGSFDDMIAGVLQSVWAANAISDGVTQVPFSFEETVDIGGGAFAYNRFAGCEISSMALNFASRAAVKGSMNIMGQIETVDTAILTGATYTQPNANPIETAVSVASLAILGLNPVPRIKNLSLNIERGLRIRDQVGSLYSSQFGISTTKVTGSFDAYFESNTVYSQVLAHGIGALSLNFGGTANKRYTISLPNVQLLDGQRKLGTRNTDVMVTIAFEAVGTSTTPLLTVTRLVA